MKRITWLFFAVLCSAILLNAEDNTMSGWICDSKCVVQVAGANTCDRGCTDRSGKAVFISDQGAVSAVSNQDVCASHMNKHVKIKASEMRPVHQQQTTEQERENLIRIMEIQDESGAG